MKDIDRLDLIKAAIAVAVADGKITRSEKGVLQGLAARAGISRASFDAMLEAAQRDVWFADNVHIRSEKDARKALELLVAQASIDGEISQEEREVISRIAFGLGLSGDEMQAAYQAGMARADKVRAARKGP